MRRQAFTLAEMLAVLAMIGLLGLITVPKMINMQTYKENAIREDLTAYEMAFRQLCLEGIREDVFSDVPALFDIFAQRVGEDMTPVATSGNLAMFDTSQSDLYGTKYRITLEADQSAAVLVFSASSAYADGVMGSGDDHIVKVTVDSYGHYTIRHSGFQRQLKSDKADYAVKPFTETWEVEMLNKSFNDGLVWAGDMVVGYSGMDKDVVIPENCTGIGDYAFSGNTHIQSVSFGSAVSSIGEGAFLGCSNLTTVSSLSHISSLGPRAFAQSGLVSLEVPAIDTIPEGLCCDCAVLTDVQIPGTVIAIDSQAFANTGLVEVLLPEGIVVAADAFDGTAVTIPTGGE